VGETTNSKPLGRIIMMCQSETLSQQLDHIYYTRLGNARTYADLKPISWAKPAYVGCSSSNNSTLQDPIYWWPLEIHPFRAQISLYFGVEKVIVWVALGNGRIQNFNLVLINFWHKWKASLQKKIHNLNKQIFYFPPICIYTGMHNLPPWQILSTELTHAHIHP
jgi:hypothetical protein